MHELSIAQSIVQLSEQQAREHHSSQIEEVANIGVCDGKCG